MRTKKIAEFKKRKYVRGGFAAAMIMLILAVMAIASLIVFGSLSVSNIKLPEYEFGRAGQDSQVRDLNNLSTSDEIGAIEKDINSTNLENLDLGIDDVSTEASDL